MRSTTNSNSITRAKLFTDEMRRAIPGFNESTPNVFPNNAILLLDELAAAIENAKTEASPFVNKLHAVKSEAQLQCIAELNAFTQSLQISREKLFQQSYYLVCEYAKKKEQNPAEAETISETLKLAISAVKHETLNQEKVTAIESAVKSYKENDETTYGEKRCWAGVLMSLGGLLAGTALLVGYTALLVSLMMPLSLTVFLAVCVPALIVGVTLFAIGASLCADSHPNCSYLHTQAGLFADIKSFAEIEQKQAQKLEQQLPTPTDNPGDYQI